MKTIGISNFIKKQTQKNGKTNLNNISLEDIALYAQDKLNQRIYRKGYRDGVILIETSDVNFCKN